MPSLRYKKTYKSQQTINSNFFFLPWQDLLDMVLPHKDYTYAMSTQQLSMLNEHVNVSTCNDHYR